MISPAYPNTLLQQGSRGSSVARVQSYLNELEFPSIAKLSVDGKFGAGTKRAVQQYQTLKGLKADGIVGKATWDALVAEHSAKLGSSADTYPGIALRSGDSGQDVQHMQTALNALARTYPAIGTLTADGKFGANTQSAVRRFQMHFGLNTDGVIGKNTWDKIVAVKNAADAGTPAAITAPYGGAALREGSFGDSVRIAQSALNKTGARLNVDGKFGAGTKAAVINFQRAMGLQADGVIGRSTWNALIAAFNAAL